MEYFDLDNFLLRFAVLLEGQYTIRQRNKEGEPLEYKISATPSDFVFLSFKEEDNQVSVNLEFGTYTDKDFIEAISDMVAFILEEEE